MNTTRYEEKYENISAVLQMSMLINSSTWRSELRFTTTSKVRGSHVSLSRAARMIGQLWNESMPKQRGTSIHVSYHEFYVCVVFHFSGRGVGKSSNLLICRRKADSLGNPQAYPQFPSCHYFMNFFIAFMNGLLRTIHMKEECVGHMEHTKVSVTKLPRLHRLPTP